MRGSATVESDPFGTMLAWSAALHLGFFALAMLVARLARPEPAQQIPAVAWVVPGVPGASASAGGLPGSSPPPELRSVEEKPPRVVRPTKEERQQMPLPDAKPGRSKPESPPSGLTGRDAASAPSAALKTESPAGIAGLGLGASGGSPFDQEFEYAYYVQQMLSKISLHWQRVAVRGSAVAVVRFTILKTGRLEAIEVEQSSGVSLLDRAAERAVYLSDPLPPLPDSYPRDRVGVHLRFEYTERE